MDAPAPSPHPAQPKGVVSYGHFIIFCVLVLAMLVLAILSCICCGVKRRRSKKTRRRYFEDNGGLLLKKELSNGTTGSETRIFTEKQLKKATKGYSEKNILGQGVFGTVYKGTMSSVKQVVVVKKENIDAPVTNQRQLVMALIGSSSHSNLVRVLGCCLETKMPLMVYEYVANATSLREKIRQNKWSWELRLKVATEIAGVLAYLHYGTKEEVVHGNVKAANVLLDDTNTAKLSDLGASGWIGVLGLPTLVERTLGYLDPEFIRTKSFTTKSDVYSFGVILAELMTSKEPFSCEDKRTLASFFVSSLKENGAVVQIVDPELVRDGNDFETVEKVANIAKRCLSLKGKERPTMKQVAEELQALLDNTKLLHSQRQENDRRNELQMPANAYVVHVRGAEEGGGNRPIGS